MGLDVFPDVAVRLAEAGFAVLRPGTAAGAAAMANRLGPVLDKTEVRVGNGRTYLSSADGIPPHTDHPAARFVLWFCHRDDRSGAGANILVDTRSVILALPAQRAVELASVELPCPGIQALVPTSTHPLYDPERQQIFYAPWLCMRPPPASLVAFEAETGRLQQQRRILLHAGEALLIDNWRMLHLRGALPKDSDRWLTRYWIGEEEHAGRRQ
jgi:hypothetical protein